MRLPRLRDATLLAAVATVAAWLFVAQPGRVTVQVPPEVTLRLEWNPSISGTATIVVPSVPPIVVRVPIEGHPTITVTVAPTP